jgi:Isoleucyl-tRNA synthetase (EC 6.1.1.5)
MSEDTSGRERFEAVSDQYDPDAVEDRVFEHWDAVDAYERTVEHRAGAEAYYFLDGPPYTSGSAHMGHAWNKSLKDCYIRYKRMQGYDVFDRPGYDMHGLPIETKVEAELGFENKKDIEAYGVDAFVEACRGFAEDSLAQLTEDFREMGVWMDWENPYKTVQPEYMEAAWWGFAQAHDRGLVEQGERSITQCPRCETAIAKNEVEFEDVDDPSVYVKFPLQAAHATDGADEYLVVWTTTPWTIPANTFVAADPEFTTRRCGSAATSSGSPRSVSRRSSGSAATTTTRSSPSGPVRSSWGGATTTRWARWCPRHPTASRPGRCTQPSTSRPTGRGWFTPRPVTARKTSSAGSNSGWRRSVRSGRTGSSPTPPERTPASS